MVHELEGALHAAGDGHEGCAAQEVGACGDIRIGQALRSCLPGVMAFELCVLQGLCGKACGIAEAVSGGFLSGCGCVLILFLFCHA